MRALENAGSLPPTLPPSVHQTTVMQGRRSRALSALSAAWLNQLAAALQVWRTSRGLHVPLVSAPTTTAGRVPGQEWFACKQSKRRVM